MTLAMDLGAAAEDGVHIAPRREFNPYAPIRPNVLYCYGVDFMSTKEVLAAFGDYAPQNIEWIDDSSCNVIFEGADVPTRALQELASGPREPEEPWTVTRPLTAGGDVVPQKARRAPPREFQLELRMATEADRKDLGHSGHTDSVYYAHVKEQQALEKERLEALQNKKRQRRSRLPVSRESQVVECPAAASEAPSMTDASAPPANAAQVAEPEKYEAAKLGRRGLLDPLLFLRAPGASNASGEVAQTPEASENAKTDLRALLQRSEAEYVSVAIPQTLTQKAPQVRGRQLQRGRAKGSGKGRDSTPRPGRDRSPGATSGSKEQKQQSQSRGKKRRPVSQEPRPVSTAAPPPRKVHAFPQVEEFLKESNLRCQRFALQQSYRRIHFAHTSKKSKSKAPDKESDAGMTDATQPEKQLSPWEEYFRVNSNFIRQGHFMHTVAWDAEGRRVLAVVPHPKRVSIEHLARATQVKQPKQRKLKDIEKETGFPVFVCPPFGHPKDAQGRAPLLLVDSSVMELKRPLLFDCGFVGLSVMPHEFVSMTRAVCVEGLAEEHEVKDVASVGAVSTANLEREATVANKAEENSSMQSSVLPTCGPPQILGPEVGAGQAEVQQSPLAPCIAGDATMGS